MVFVGGQYLLANDPAKVLINGTFSPGNPLARSSLHRQSGQLPYETSEPHVLCFEKESLASPWDGDLPL